MTFQLKTLKTLKEKLDKTAMDAGAKYWYLAGALDFVFEDGKGIIDLPKPINIPEIPISIPKPILNPFEKPKDHPIFAPQILKPEPCKTKPKKYSVDSCKVMIMNTLPMGTMSVNEMIKYNNIALDCNIYQMMNTAANLLTYDHKILKKQKTKCRGTQYEYSMPSDMPTKIVLNGDMVEQQRRV
jgi:hypothetical protein